MFNLDLIPDVALSLTVAQVDIEGGTFNVLDELPTEFAFTWSAVVGSGSARASVHIDGRVAIPLSRILAEAGGREYRAITVEALSRYFKKILRVEIKAQLLELKKEPTP